MSIFKCKIVPLDFLKVSWNNLIWTKNIKILTKSTFIFVICIIFLFQLRFLINFIRQKNLFVPFRMLSFKDFITLHFEVLIFYLYYSFNKYYFLNSLIRAYSIPLGGIQILLCNNYGPDLFLSHIWTRGKWKWGWSQLCQFLESLHVLAGCKWGNFKCFSVTWWAKSTYVAVKGS